MTALTLSAPAGPAAALAGVGSIVAGLAPLADLVGQAATWPADERRRLLGQLDRAVDGLGAVRAAVLLAERESGAWQGAGDRSFPAWRARTSLAGERAAAAQVHQAEHLAAVPSVAAAVTEGRVGLDHAAAIGRVAATGTPAQQAAVASPDAQAHLLRIAQEQDAGTFATTVAGWAATVDPAALEADHQAQRRARFVHLSDTPRGTVIKGQVDTMAGHRLRLALDALSPRPGADDDRDPAQRRADALDAMAGRVLSDADTKPGAHVPPHVSMILTEATWHAARTERDRQRQGSTCQERSGPQERAADEAPVDTVTVTSELGYEPATLEDGTPCRPASSRWRCATARSPASSSTPRAPPSTSGAPSACSPDPNAARSSTASAPGPRATPRPAGATSTTSHHIAWWDRDGGPTPVELGVLVCTFHHHEIHRRDLTVTRRTHPPGKAGSAARKTAAAGAPLARYEFRDPTGRLLGEPSVGGRRSGREPPDRRPGRPPDEPPIEWTTDPVTGVRAPAFFVTR